MKQYKHIPTGKIAEKKYPGYEIDKIHLPEWLIENSSDWEEVKPKEYEVLTYNHDKREIHSDTGECGCPIHSVKRLSDGEVFTVGDKVKYPFGGYPSEIKKIILVNKEDEDVVAAISEGSLGKIALCVDRYVGNLLLENAVKILNQVLFTTEDGVEIRQGEEYFWIVIHPSGWNVWRNIAEKENASFQNNQKNFSSKELAEEYVLMNKPCLSVDDAMKILDYYTDGKKYWTNDEFNDSLVELAKSKING